MFFFCNLKLIIIQYFQESAAVIRSNNNRVKKKKVIRWNEQVAGALGRARQRFLSGKHKVGVRFILNV